MTIGQLIAKLQEYPTDAKVVLEVIHGNSGYVEVNTSTVSSDVEIYETVNDEICIQAIQ